MSDFSALNTALSGLTAHQKALQVAGHNVANAATPGYSRQRADLSSIGGGVIPAVWSKSDGIGRGVQITGLVRIRDEFLEARMLRETATGSQLRSLGAVMDRIELIFPEPSDVGLAHQLAELWGSFDDVANQPGSISTRIALLERAATVAHELNRASTELANLHTSILGQAEVLVSEVNATAARVAELNGAIRNATNAGLSPHDLADQRDQLIERLGNLVGVTTRHTEDGAVNVFLGGTTLVRGDRAESLTLRVDDQPGANGLKDARIVWTKDGYPGQVESGQVAGLLAGANNAIPRYVADLDKVAVALATQVNEIHSSGFDLDGNAGAPFYASVDGGPITAASIRLGAQLRRQPRAGRCVRGPRKQARRRRRPAPRRHWRCPEPARPGLQRTHRRTRGRDPGPAASPGDPERGDPPGGRRPRGRAGREHRRGDGGHGPGPACLCRVGPPHDRRRRDAPDPDHAHRRGRQVRGEP
jgi:flagellar hook-associated protein 1